MFKRCEDKSSEQLEVFYIGLKTIEKLNEKCVVLIVEKTLMLEYTGISRSKTCLKTI